jgi:F-type H+-transporting ATPase subunit b
MGSESTVRSAYAFACEILNKLRSPGAAAAAVILGLGLTAGMAFAQGPAATPAVGAAQGADAHAPAGHDDPGAVAEEAHAAAGTHDADDAHVAGAHDTHDAAGAHGDAHHEESIWVTLARVANFALLVGGLFYFLREPVAQHLESRRVQIRSDLETAARVKAEAAARIAEIEQHLARLPQELELVRQRGAEEVAAEEARIARQAEVERERLIAQAQREIEQQMRTARQELREYAASLAIGVADQRLRTTLTEEEHRRLADAFTQQIGGAR